MLLSFLENYDIKLIGTTCYKNRYHFELRYLSKCKKSRFDMLISLHKQKLRLSRIYVGM